MDTKDLQIIAQSAGAHAATIVAAGVVGVDDFEKLRKDLFYGVLELVKEASDIQQAEAANVVQAHFPGATEVPQQSAAPVPVPPPVGPAQQAPPPPPGAPAAAGAGNCPQCGGPAWDNRQNKRNPKAPDFKCKEANGPCKDKSGRFPFGWWG